MNQRTDALVNGVLIAIGALGVVDNLVIHWALRLHRAVPGRHAFAVEVVLTVVSVGLLALGVWRELSARRMREG